MPFCARLKVTLCADAGRDRPSCGAVRAGRRLGGIVDFDNVRPQPAVVDVAWTVSLTCYSEADDFEPDSMAEALAGYASARSLSEAERRLLLPVVVLPGFGSRWGTRRQSKAETSGTTNCESGSSGPRACALTSEIDRDSDTRRRARRSHCPSRR